MKKVFSFQTTVAKDYRVWLYFSESISLRSEFKRGKNTRAGPQIRRASREHGEDWLLWQWGCLIMREETEGRYILLAPQHPRFPQRSLVPPQLPSKGGRKGSTLNPGTSSNPCPQSLRRGSRPVYLLRSPSLGSTPTAQLLLPHVWPLEDPPQQQD